MKHRGGGVSLCVLAVLLLAPFVASADFFVDGYYKQDGTYVQPHWRSDPNDSRLDNWSTRGNVNPYTGERGAKDPGSDYLNPYGRQDSGDCVLWP